MNTAVYRIVYCSRNQIIGTPEEIEAEIQLILASSRKNNASAGVTGALLFNQGLFAQVLEGSLEGVERIFEKIQRDPRHSDVTVLQNGTAGHRDFAEWSMAFASSESKSAFGFGIPAFNAAQSNPSVAAEQVLKLLREVVVQEDWMMPS
jgi:hypothetical protein